MIDSIYTDTVFYGTALKQAKTAFHLRIVVQ